MLCETTASFVYWLFDDSCDTPEKSGYVGVTVNVTRRIGAHRLTGEFNPASRCRVLFSGTRQQCFAVELSLRPRPLVGWNTLAGGRNGYKFGAPESTKQKISAANRGRPRPDLREANERRWSNKHERLALAERNRKNPWSKGHKNALGHKHSHATLQRISEAGKGNQYALGKKSWNKGKTHSEEARQKMRIAWTHRKRAMGLGPT